MKFQAIYALSLLAVGISASPIKSLNERGVGGDMFGALLEYSAKEFSKVFGEPAACASHMPEDETFMVGTGQGDLEIPYMWCYNEGENEFTQADADAAKCLINLHYVQDDKCISVKGSMCEDGYDGMLQNIQMSWVYGPYDISSDQSLSFQAAVDGLVGKKIKNHKPESGQSYMPILTLTSETNDLGMVSMYLRYEGEDEC